MRTFLLAIPLMAAWQAHAASLIDETAPPFPEGFSSEIGKCIAEGGDICAYGISTLHDGSGTVIAVLGDLLVKDGSARARVMDQMPAPITASDQLWSLECGIDGHADPAVIGIVTYDNSSAS